MAERLRVKVNGRWYMVEVDDLSARPVRAVVDGQIIDVNVGSLTRKAPPAPAPRPAAGRATTPVTAPPITPAPRPKPVSAPTTPQVVVNQPSATKLFSAPMPGTILSIDVAVGDQVVTGDPICVLEAMKMQQILRADWSGVVSVVHVVVGQQVSDGSPIVELE